MGLICSRYLSLTSRGGSQSLLYTSELVVHIPKDSLEAVIQKEKDKKTKTKRKALKPIFRVHVSRLCGCLNV